MMYYSKPYVTPVTETESFISRVFMTWCWSNMAWKKEIQRQPQLSVNPVWWCISLWACVCTCVRRWIFAAVCVCVLSVSTNPQFVGWNYSTSPICGVMVGLMSLDYSASDPWGSVWYRRCSFAHLSNHLLCCCRNLYWLHASHKCTVSHFKAFSSLCL